MLQSNYTIEKYNQEIICHLSNTKNHKEKIPVTTITRGKRHNTVIITMNAITAIAIPRITLNINPKISYNICAYNY